MTIPSMNVKVELKTPNPTKKAIINIKKLEFLNNCFIPCNIKISSLFRSLVGGDGGLFYKLYMILMIINHKILTWFESGLNYLKSLVN